MHKKLETVLNKEVVIVLKDESLVKEYVEHKVDKNI